MSLRSVYPHIDVDALSRRGIVLCSNLHDGSHCSAVAELTFALLLAAMRQLLDRIASARGDHWQAGVGRTLAGRTLGLYGYGRIRCAGLIASGTLLTALDAGRPGTAVQDMFDREPVTDPRNLIISHPRVIPTSHIGYVTED